MPERKRFFFKLMSSLIGSLCCGFSNILKTPFHSMLSTQYSSNLDSYLPSHLLPVSSVRAPLPLHQCCRSRHKQSKCNKDPMCLEWQSSKILTEYVLPQLTIIVGNLYERLCHCLCLFYLCYDFPDIFPKFSIASTHSAMVNCFESKNASRGVKGEDHLP